MSRMLVLSSALLASVFATQVLAAEGKIDGHTCYAGPVQVTQDEGILAGSYAVVGMGLGIQDTPFSDLLSSRCVGAFSLVNGQIEQHSTCEYVNTSGEKYFLIAERKGDPAKAEGTWHFIHGTGKFAGITGGGGWMPIGAFPPAPGAPNTTMSCNHEWGTYNIK